jgi:hypothetical protein
MNNLPPALRPVYTTAKPNENILLYEGSLEISSHINQHLVQTQGSGTLEYVWFPSPCIKFNFSNQDRDIDIISYAHANNLPTSLTLSDVKVSVNVSISSSSSGGKDGNFVSGRIQEAVVQGKDQDLAYVLFHVVNFHNFIGRPPSVLVQGSTTIERIVFEAEEWKITLDQLEITTENVKSLNSQGGFAITHVGKLEKLNGQSFSGKDATDVLKIVADFLSFARGFRVPLILLCGYDAKNNQIWKCWDSAIGHSWKYVDSWFPMNEAHILADVLPGFLSWWRDWKESAKVALYSYLESNFAPTLEVKILLSQLTLESMARVLLVEKEKIETEKWFDSRSTKTSDKLRKLLERLKIPFALPPDQPTKSYISLAERMKPESPPLLKDLQELAAKHQWEDGLHALTTIRNDIVHTKKNIENLETYLYDASDLGLWYLELVLLAIFDYQGCYHNRLPKYQQNGEIEPVPWSNSN